MSNYPPPPDYGHGYGSQDQSQPPYVPPAYPNQYLQPTTAPQGSYAYPMASHMENAQAAYAYNQSIPSAAIAPAVPPLPIFQGWNQDPMPLPPYTAPQNGTQAPAYNGGYYSNQTYPAAPQQTQTHQNHQPYTQYMKPAEEGELSEGEFEYRGAAASAVPNNHEATQHWNNDGNGYVDTAHRAVYARNQDATSRAANDYNYGRISPQTRRQEYDSYSPYASPRETEYSPANNGSAYRPSPPAPKHGNQRSFSHGGAPKFPRVKGTPDPYKSKPHTNGNQSAEQIEPVPEGELSIAQQHSSHAATTENATREDREQGEAELLRVRKQAQAAVLQLLTKDVDYPTYIAEGFDKNIVGRYFDDLKLSKSPSKVSVQSTADLTATNGTSVSQKDSGHPSQPTKPEGPSSLPAKPIVAAKPPVPTEKELQLKLKMEALRKSREERAQKAAAKNNPVSPVATVDQKEQPKDVVVDKLSIPPSVTKPVAPPQAQSAGNSTSPPTVPVPSQPQNAVPVSLAPTAQTQPIPVAQTGPIIPGLFLASSAAPASAGIPNPTQASAMQSGSRKRPVAADFDSPTTITPKRPFGQSRDDRPLVIDVSDEEEEDVAMDLDSQYDQESPVQAARTLSDSRNSAINNLPPPSDLPSRKLLTTPPATDTYPPAAQNTAKFNLGKPEDLQRKMKEIEEMRKKIADAERRRKARQSSSGANTPRRVENGQNATNMASKVEASLQIDRLVTLAENKATEDQQKLAEAQAAELEKAAELKRNEAEQKRLRREKLSKELPRVDAEVQQKQTQLEQLQAEMAKIQAAIQKDLAEKQSMIEEREKLGREAEDQLQAQKDKLKDLNNRDTGSSTAPSRPTSQPLQDVGHVSKSATALPQQQPRSEIPEAKDSFTLASSLEAERQPASSATDVNASDVNAPDVNAPDDSSRDSDRTESASEKMDVEPHVATPDQMLEAALQDAMRAEVESLEVAENKAPDADMADSYAPDPHQLAPESASSLVEEDVQSQVASPLLQRKAVGATEGESDDYEPREATPPVDTTDDYEPREASPVMGNASPVTDPPPPAPVDSPTDSPPFSPAPPEPVSDVAQSPYLGLLSTGINEQHDLESTAPSRNSAVQLPVVENDVEENSSKAAHPFTPYESPLKVFRAYRFHPAFKKDIPGGYRSMSYSHKFDPNKEFCRYELAGGFCNDPECGLQHFKNVGLSDNDILTSLTSMNEFSGEQRGKFVTGLKEVFAGLREKNLDKDFDSIASALVAHRAQFLGDDSKVLSLEGTTL